MADIAYPVTVRDIFVHEMSFINVDDAGDNEAELMTMHLQADTVLA